LIIACEKGDIALVKYLIKQGADVNKATQWYDPLIVACTYNEETIVKYLIEHGANPNKRFIDYRRNFTTPYLTTLKNSNIKLLKYLKAHGAKDTILINNLDYLSYR